LQFATISLTTDERIKNKIQQLVDDGVYSVSEMKRHIFHYVRTELVSDKSHMPQPCDRRYFPTSQDYRNIIYKRRMANIHSRIDQVNLRAKLAHWSTEYSNDSFYFREYGELNDAGSVVTDHNDDDGSATVEDNDIIADEDDDVLIHATRCSRLLFCHQSDWQRHLLKLYGNEICLLDATYKTSKYALPLFFICVKTNVNYAVVGSFVIQSEDSAAIAEALSVFRKWNPSWQPRNWMVDFSEMEINALRQIFPGNVNLYSAFR